MGLVSAVGLITLLGPVRVDVLVAFLVWIVLPQFFSISSLDLFVFHIPNSLLIRNIINGVDTEKLTETCTVDYLILNLLAAKSIFCFGDLSKSKEVRTTEYVLLGTFSSFMISILIGFGVILLLINVP